MAVLTKISSGLTGAAITFTAAAGGGDSFVNDGNTVLHVKNGGGSSINVTINSTRQCDQGFDHDLVVAVDAAAEQVIGPFSVARFGRSVGITYSGVTSVTVAVVGE